MKKRIVLTLVLAMAIRVPSIAYGAAAVNPSVKVNGNTVDLGQGSFTSHEGHLMIPLRPLTQELNYKTTWDNKDKSVTLLKEGQALVFKTGQGGLPTLKDNKIFVSPEFVSRSLDTLVGWNSKNQKLNIRTIKATKAPFFASGADEEIMTQLSSYMDALVKNENFHGSVLLAKEGEILLNQGYGYGDFTQKIKNKPQTRFSIGSVTKQFAAFGILELSGQGLLRVEDPVSKYIAGFPNGDKITIHHLLTHTSGLANYTDLEGFYMGDRTNTDPVKMLNLVKDLALSFEPGEKFEYSNTNYLLLGIIIEKITGHSFSDFLDGLILPLGMEDTGMIDSKTGRVNDATPYVGFQEVEEVDDDLVLSQAYAAGSMYSTVQDLYRWDQLSKPEEMLKGHVAISEGISYGYGLMIEETDQGVEISHGGNTIGSTAYIGNLVGEDITVIILSNNAGYNTEELKDDLTSIALGKPYKMPQALTQIKVKDKSVYNRYVGDYKFQEGFTMNITTEGGKLYAQLTGQGRFEIFPLSETEFFYKIVEAQIHFEKDEDRKVNSLMLHQMGAQMRAIK